MFYERLKELCRKRGKRISNVLKELEMSSGNMSRWSAGNVPVADTLDKLADYFEVSVDYLLGKTDMARKMPDEDEQLIYALYDDIRDLSPAQRREIMEYIRFKKQQKGEVD